MQQVATTSLQAKRPLWSTIAWKTWQRFFKRSAMKAARYLRRPMTQSTGSSGGSWIRKATRLNFGNHRPGNNPHATSQQSRRLTPRSSGAPTAGHQARAGGTRYIFASRAWRPAVVAHLARTLGGQHRSQIVKTFVAQTADQWRKWLDEHHDSESEVWLIFHKLHTGVKSIALRSTR